MPAPPMRRAPAKWTALPKNGEGRQTLDALLDRMVNVQIYPERFDQQGRARCVRVTYLDYFAPDPHDWHLWRTGDFVAYFDSQVEVWSLLLRRCSACESIDVRLAGTNQHIPSGRSPNRLGSRRVHYSDELIGVYRGEPRRP